VVILRLAILLTLLAIPIAANAHAEIFFPKVFTPAELRTSGFVLLNPDPLTATVSVYLISTAGAPSSSKTFTIPPGGQSANLGTDLFSDATANGWVYVLTDTEGMQAFWLNYNDDLSSLDGAEADGYDTIGADQVIPLVAGQTELNVINPNFVRLQVTIRLFGANGELAAAVSRPLPPAGAFQAQVSELFATVDVTAARYVRIQTSSATIASSAVIRGYLVPREMTVVNGINVSPRSDLTFPHVVTGVLGGANYSTILGITNTSTSPQAITIVFNSDSGDTFTATPNLPAGGSLRETAGDLFGFSNEFRSGWLKVTGSASITGFAAYADTVGGALAVAPAAKAESKIFFSHIANGPPAWQTGIALLNAGEATANVEISAINPAGGLIGGAANVATARIVLEPGKKTAKVIDELIPQTRGVNGGFVFVTSDSPIFGLELFYTRDLNVLSNVAAGRLVQGVAYQPPSP
jgi:hypothetical protein